MEIFKSLHHRKILTQAIGKKLTFSALAQVIKVQKTYVSRVMAGNACWSGDQAFLIAEALEFSEDEVLYFSLLVELERSGVEKRRAKLQAKIKELRRKHLRSQRSLSETTTLHPERSPPQEYFADPYHSLAHVFLSIPKFRRQMRDLAQALGIPLAHLHSLLGVLEKMGVLHFDRAKDQVSLKEQSIHTPAGSPLVMAHQQLFRALAIDRIHRCPPDRKNNFSVVFTGDSTLQETIWAEFLEFLKRAQSISQNSSAKEVFYLQFDLFPWAHHSQN